MSSPNENLRTYRTRAKLRVEETQQALRRDLTAYMLGDIDRAEFMESTSAKLSLLADQMNGLAGNQYILDRDNVDEQLVRDGKPRLPTVGDLDVEKPSDPKFQEFSRLSGSDLGHILKPFDRAKPGPDVDRGALDVALQRLDAVTKRKATMAGAWATQGFVAQENQAQAKIKSPRVSTREVRYVRVPKNRDCGFCVTVASQGAVYSTKRSAGGDGNKFHENCGCVVKAVWSDDDLPADVMWAQAAYGHFERMPRQTDASGKPLTTEESINRFERFLKNLPYDPVTGVYKAVESNPSGITSIPWNANNPLAAPEGFIDRHIANIDGAPGSETGGHVFGVARDWATLMQKNARLPNKTFWRDADQARADINNALKNFHTARSPRSPIVYLQGDVNGRQTEVCVILLPGQEPRIAQAYPLAGTAGVLEVRGGKNRGKPPYYLGTEELKSLPKEV